jgi:nicotinate-nucleotide adenylyltransferase
LCGPAHGARISGGRRIGLLGGSFNPAHGGHRRVSLFAKTALGLDEVWWMVSPGNPLKSASDMGPLAARFASAVVEARRAPIRVTAIERELGTRYTTDTLKALSRRYPKHRFVWLMGADNLAQFHLWKDWRGLARTMPIAVIARPGYNGDAFASVASAWFSRHKRAASHWPQTRKTPALIHLRFDPDTRSASAIRRADPAWAERFEVAGLRDQVTHRLISNRIKLPHQSIGAKGIIK